MGGFFKQRPGDGEPLPLAARERAPALADDRRETIGLARDELDGLRALERLDHFGIGRLGSSDLQVLADRARKQHRLLEHHADVAAKRRQGEVADVVVVDADRARLRIEGAVEKAEGGGLARPRCADQRDVLARQHR